MTRALGLGFLVILGLSFFISPANAAVRLLNVHEENQTVTSVYQGTLCGVTDSFNVSINISHFTLMAWDNGKFLASVSFHGAVYSSSGERTARINAVQSQVSGAGSLPMILSYNTQTICSSSTVTPGLNVLLHESVTVGKDEEIVQSHIFVISR